jgi:hypothetical protein
MNDKAALLEAVKRKRAMIQYQSKDAEDPNHDGMDKDDGELAPDGSANKASTHDALLGHPDGKDTGNEAETPEESKNETAEGQDGFPNISHASAPGNSKNLFVNPKKDTHDAVDLNRDRDMAGVEGDSNQHDDMGVDTHKDVRRQSSGLAHKNAVKAEGIKNAVRKDVKSKVEIPDNVPSHGEDAKDAVSGVQSDNPGKLTGMKSARAKLDGFLSKMKTNKSW